MPVPRVQASPRPRLTVEATPGQAHLIELALAGQTRHILFGGGIRGGKTYGALLMLTVLAKTFPGSRWAITRRTLPDLRRTVIPTWRQMHVGDFWKPINQSDWTATAENGSQVLFFPESLDTDPELQRWRGLEVSGFVNEEGNELAERSYTKCIERSGTWICRSGKQPPPLDVTTCNPSPGWVKRLFYDPWKAGTLPEGRAFLPALAADNPHLPDALREAWHDLPERDYRRFVLGEWDDLGGAALEELDETHHLIAPFDVPAHWPRYGAFDWGFTHPFSFGWFTMDEQGRLYLVDSLRSRRLRDDQIAEAIIEASPKGFEPDKLENIVAGRDCWARFEARSDSKDKTPSTAERFAEHGLFLTPANVARVAGLSTFRGWLAWKPVRPGLPERDPTFKMMRTHANLRLFDRLKEILIDPDHGSDAKKVDADPDTGEGGDDEYDMVRYFLASRPKEAEPPAPDIESAWDKRILAWEAERKAKGLPVDPTADGTVAHPTLTRNMTRQRLRARLGR